MLGWHRFFSCRRWSLLALTRRLAGWVLDRLVPQGPVYLAADDTVDEHKGDQVYGKGCHRDAVRSSHSYTAFRWGHKWLVVFVLVAIPGASRLWALPIFVILCHSEKEDQKHGRRHRTPAQRLFQAMLVLRRWFPDRQFILAADGGFASHEMTSGIARRVAHTTYVSRFYANAALYDPPPPVVYKANGKRAKAGAPRVKGAKRDTPEQVVAKRKERTRLRVLWYGGEDRQVEVVSGTGHWYKAGQGLVEVPWVYVHDKGGTHRDEYFYSTALAMTAKEVIETYTRRWNTELDIRAIKQTLQMDILSCQTPEMVRKEVWAHLLAYNLVRAVMAQAARKKPLKPREVSFAGAVQTVTAFRWLLLLLGEDKLAAAAEALLVAVGTHKVGDRPGRCEPRKKKRRPKGFPLLMKPRAQERAALLGQNG